MMTKLARTVRDLAAFGELFFTKKQLYYEFCRSLRAPHGLETGIAAAVFGVGLLPTWLAARQNRRLGAGLLAANAAINGAAVWRRNAPHVLAPPLSWAEFEDILANIEAPPNLLAAAIENADENEFAVDFPLYGLPRLLICQSPDISQMLLANNFHLEASCVILSLPQAAPLSPVLLQMLAQAENSRVFYLHDADWQTFQTLPDLREKLDLPSEINLQMLGLRPSHAQKMHLFVERGVENPAASLEKVASLTNSEKKWLTAGFRAEVAAVAPVRLLRVVRRLVLNLPEPPNRWKISLPRRETNFMS